MFGRPHYLHVRSVACRVEALNVSDQGSLSKHDSTKIISLSGVVDALTGKELRDDVSQALDQGFQSIQIEFEAGTYIDSNGFGALIACLKKTKESGARLTLRGLNNQVRLVLEMTGADRIFDIFKESDESGQDLGAT